jgi:hypothetical protein
MSGYTLINMQTGTLYDFSQYEHTDSNSVAYNAAGLRYLVDGDTLYAVHKTNTLYKIDLNNISTAVPLNNPEFFPAYIPCLVIGDKILSQNLFNHAIVTSFDVNGVKVPKTLQGVVLTEGNCVLALSGNPFTINISQYDDDNASLAVSHIIDSNRDVWYYCFAGFTGIYSGDDFSKKYFKCKIAIDDDGQLSISDYSAGTTAFEVLNSSTRKFMPDGTTRLLSTNGLVIVGPGPSGAGITITEKTATYPAWYYLTGEKESFTKGEYTYRVDIAGKSIKRMKLFLDSSEETVYANSNMLPASVVFGGDKIIFKQMVDAVTGVTLSLSYDNPSAGPEQVSASTMEIEEIIELVF